MARSEGIRDRAADGAGGTDDDDRFHARARSRLVIAHATDTLVLAGIIACMVMLHYGL